MRHAPSAQGDIGCRLPCPGIERVCRLVCEDQGSFMGGHMASETDSGSALPPSLGRVLIASILAWLSIPKTMYIQTALTQLIMPLLMWSMLTITLLRASPEMKDILRSGRSCLSSGVSQSQELDSYYIVAPFVL